MSADFGPCESWDAYYPCDVSTISDTRLTQATSMATSVVDGLSGRQFGVCPITIRPCLRECYTTPYIAGYTPWPGGEIGLSPWYAYVGCGSGCTGTCSCTKLSEVVLPAPVDSIVTVTIDGSPIVTGAYQLYDSRMLVRTDGEAWPRCNDLSKTDTEEGTWSIEVNVGRQVPEGGKWAVGELACQLLKAMNDEECRLPRTVTRLARQGVTIEYPDIAQLFKDGLTGLYLVDTWVQSVNPAKLKQQSKTYSVDGTLARRPT